MDNNIVKFLSDSSILKVKFTLANICCKLFAFVENCNFIILARWQRDKINEVHDIIWPSHANVRFENLFHITQWQTMGTTFGRLSKCHILCICVLDGGGPISH